MFRYSHAQVKNKQINAFHARGSSAKEKINLNKVLICYMMHGTSLYIWTNNGMEDLELVSNHASNLYYMSDDVVFFMKTKAITVGTKTIEQSKIYMVES